MGSINPTRDQMAAMRDSAGAAGAIHMINLLRFRERAAYPEGHECAGQAISGKDAYKRYLAETAHHLGKVGGRMVWSGAPSLTLIGPNDERWDMAFIAEYPSVAAMLQMLADKAYQASAVHRTAGVEDSRLIRCAPRS